MRNGVFILQISFGGEYNYLGRFGEMPSETPIPEIDKNKIMHVSLPISKETILFGSDSNSTVGDVVIGRNISLSINAQSKKEADKLFTSLSEGGQITMPIANTFWGAYFGMFVDKFGIHWMVNYDEMPK